MVTIRHAVTGEHVAGMNASVEDAIIDLLRHYWEDAHERGFTIVRDGKVVAILTTISGGRYQGGKVEIHRPGQGSTTHEVAYMFDNGGSYTQTTLDGVPMTEAE